MSTTENGRTDDPASTVLQDDERIDHLHGHLLACSRAISDGARLEGHHRWSLLDNVEWAEGYAQRFGLVRVAFVTQVRTPKESAHWHADVIRTNAVTV